MPFSLLRTLVRGKETRGPAVSMRTAGLLAGCPVDNRPRPAPGVHTGAMGRVHERGERGQALSTFVVVAVIALLLVTGLVVDGGRKSAADRRAELTAAAAARSAADATATQRQAGRRPDAGVAIAAANQVIGAEPGIQGSATLAADGSVQVTTSTSIDTVFLSLIGINSLQGHGSAKAQLYD